MKVPDTEGSHLSELTFLPTQMENRRKKTAKVVWEGVGLPIFIKELISQSMCHVNIDEYLLTTSSTLNSKSLASCPIDYKLKEYKHPSGFTKVLHITQCL